MDKRTKYCAMMTVLMFFILFASVYHDNSVLSWKEYETNLRVKKEARNPMNYDGEKKVLFWNTMFGNKWFYMGSSGHFDNCPKYNNCYATIVRDMVNIEDFDAILFHGNALNSKDLPRKRDPRQMYVYVNLESPKTMPFTNFYFENYFNATMTYRLDSDIPWPYRLLENTETREMVAPFKHVEWFEISHDPLRWELELMFDGKTKMAAWLVSHCKTEGKRELYVEEIKKYIHVDVIGGCGGSNSPKCPKSKDCFADVIEPNYFFYFSFENSLCNDYVTEKFYNALRYDVIPVVYGGADYRLYAPPHSYIDALDFDSPKKLADFLIKLSQDREEYLKYFWWKRFYNVNSVKSHVMCRLCELLNEPQTPKSISSLSDWFMKNKCPIHNALKYSKYASKYLRSRANLTTSGAQN